MGKRGAHMAKLEETRVETPSLPVAKKWYNYTCAALAVVFLADFASALVSVNHRLGFARQKLAVS